ncbi:LuxR C-terminal-related transcriptional regulator [Actinomycetospora sp. CA-101289]|uniref:LuxR C-terminal-related transcriptional regulator n=1 Tax=Actinomycetospora sp. CA-101289 TaxID=3239893 RepID=UPI003D95B2D3
MFHVPPSKVTPPPVPPEHIRRPGLEAALERGTDAALTLVCAPPGSGKTSLLAAWVASTRGPPTAWVRLEPEDTDPRRLWAAVLAALTALPGVPPSSRLHRLVVSRATVELDFVGELLEGLAALPDGVRLVLDDVQHLDRPAARHGLEMLVRGPPPGLRLVLSGRRDPPLPLPRLRLQERLREVRTEQLLFTRPEAAALLGRAGLRLTPPQVDALHERTGGWVAGLRLAAVSLRGHPDPDRFLAEFSGDERPVADYLVDEVLTGLAPEQRETLRRVSVARALPAGLAVELAGRDDAADVLDDLVRSTGLVTGTGAPGAEYRVAELLRSHLVADLGRHGPELVARTHRRAADWWSAQGRPVEALAHARWAGDAGFLADLLGRWAPRLVGVGELDALDRAAAALDADAGAEPWAGATVAHVHARQGRPTEVRAALRRARRAAPRGADALAFRTATERLVGLRGGTGACPEEADAAADPALAALVHLGRGTIGVVRDDGRAAVGELERGLGLAARHGLGALERQARCLLAAARWSVGDVAGAAVDAAAALDGVTGEEDTPWTAVARAVAAHVAVLRADPDAALGILAGATTAADAALPPALRFALRTAAGGALVDGADREAGLLALQAARAELGGVRAPAAVEITAALLEHDAASLLGHPAAGASVAGWLASRRPGCPELHLVRARTAAGAGDDHAMRHAVAPLLPGGLPPGPAPTLVEAWLLETRGRLARRDRPGARRALRTALDHALPLDARRPFVHAGDAVRALLVDQLVGGGDRAAFVARTLAARAGGAPAPSGLSSREHDVLTRLPSLESLDEIAEDLDVSINTIKSHVRAIYGKLGVSTRREAVLTAHEQGLLR